MSRRPPSDTFTRFTSTTPHAMSRAAAPGFTYQAAPNPSSSPSQSTSSRPPPQNETPQQKVARLRAAARAAKESANSSPLERVIDTGRRWADRAHRFTAYGLILFAGVSTVVAAYGTTSLIAHNRRQKRAWIERELDRLDQARAAFLRGDATAEQLHLLEQERAGEEMEAARKRAVERKSSESYYSRFRNMFASQAAKGEMGTETEAERVTRQQQDARRARGRQGPADDSFVEGEIRPTAVATGVPLPVASSGIQGVGVDSKGRPVPQDRVEYLSTPPVGQAAGVDAGTRRKGGPLDQWAGNVADAVTHPTQNQGWLSWLRGGKS
ncbi:hypothetical protein EDD36DRAFT_45196 [Exophiala viscosa]|uniref:Uncharacterized protein n=1 Tax=Exophiala viscosa TaxID=2486360 RepID=A0AAN6E6D3_9EURO|nr:hypothetical protein EDD36DRAFT_45196 [Exophiala viscosa]